MTLQQLDALLELWRQRMSAMAEALLALQAEPAYRGVAGSAGAEASALEGVTAASVREVPRTVHGLFQQFELMQARVAAAEKVRSGLPAFFGTETRLREAQQLLEGASIELRGNDAAEADELARGLAADTARTGRCSPEQMLVAMTASLAEVREAIEVVSRAWTEFAERCGAVEDELRRWRAQSVLPSAQLAEALDAAGQRLERLRELQRTDPMGALRRLRSEVEPAVASIAQRVGRAEQLRRQLAVAQCQWQTLREVRKEALTARVEAAARVQAPRPLGEPTPQAKLDGLGAWLERLQHKQAEGGAEAVAIGLRNWIGALDVCLEQDRRVLAAAQGQLAARAELRGRFEALRIKARRSTGGEAERVGRLQSEAEDLLGGRPMDSAAAVDAVARFEESLRGASPEHRPQAAVPSR